MLVTLGIFFIGVVAGVVRFPPPDNRVSNA